LWVLLAGDWHSELHEEVVLNALTQLGHTVCGFKWHEYFKRGGGVTAPVRHVLQRFENKYLAGPILNRLQKDFLAMAQAFGPDMIFIYRGTHIGVDTLRRLRNFLPQCVLVGYNNDNPFAPDQPAYLWRHFIKALPAYDLVLAYRHENINDYLQRGARRVELLRSWFVPERNHPVDLTQEERRSYECDVVFVGHYEADLRVEYLEEIVRQGIRLRLFGPGYDWDPVIEKSPWLRGLRPVKLVWGEDYNRALCGAKIALCFFSKLNRDTYTRRCFEIPATGTFLLSEFSQDMTSLYKPGEEAEFFKDRDELLKKIHAYLRSDERRTKVAAAGRARVVADRHDVVSRMTQVIQWVQAIQIQSRTV